MASRAPDPRPADLRQKAKNALLAMQRYSWEQGVAAQSFLESGDADLVILLAKEAVVRQLADGRLGVLGNLTAVTDPAAAGEPLLFAARATGDPALSSAAARMIDWLLLRAPRTPDGILYHLHDRAQVWVDSFYMAPPFLSAAGRHEEAMKQIEGFRRLLFDPGKKLMSHIWDEERRVFARKAFWGVGNGWALAGMTRVIRTLPPEMKQEKDRLIRYVREGVEGCLPWLRDDGLFHDVLDDTSTFIETNLSQMLSYVLFRGMAGGWLDRVWEKPAEKMRQAALAKV
ncbi:MAG TPA: glycoside hydrolase family 88 protein, partial [Spirochaetia bacterium]|nr:glycoside hydrolase family 88 protein [Spirochaetia bacterium]